LPDSYPMGASERSNIAKKAMGATMLAATKAR
jgi:hypothetical protein